MRLLPMTMLTGIVLAVNPAGAENNIERGRVLAEQMCARCHAVGAIGESKHPDAPQFRMLSTRYPVDALAEALAEGIVTGHPDMPEIRLEAMQVGELTDYLVSIQEE